MKKIAIGTLNAKYVHASLSPWCLRSGVCAYSQAQPQMDILDATINQDIAPLVASIVAEDYGLLGLSCYIWNIKQTLELVSAVKKECPHLPVVLGGPEVGFRPQNILENAPFVDYVLSGEGERPFAQLVDWILLGGDCPQEGLSRRSPEGMIVASPYVTKEEPPSPYCSAYFAQLQGKIAYMESSRGCPYGCSYCLSGRKEDRVRFFSLPRVEEEIIALAQSGSRTIKFVDRTFNCNLAHCDHILSFLLEEYNKRIPPHVTFHFEMAGDILAESTLTLLESMPKGYVQLEIGMQSFHAPTLEAVGRPTDIPRLTQNIRRLLSFENHHLHIDLIVGLPLEGWNEFESSFNIAYDLGADMLQVGFLKLLWGSPLESQKEEYGIDYHSQAPYQVISTAFLSQEEILLLQGVETHVDKLYNAGRFPRTLAYLTKKIRPFDCYLHLAKSVEVPVGQSLDDYIDALYQSCLSLEGIEPLLLRDYLVQDRASTNNTGILPSSLKREDSRLRKLTIALEQYPETARPLQGKRFVGILYAPERGMYVDYPAKSKGNKHNKEHYAIHEVSLEQFLSPFSEE